MWKDIISIVQFYYFMIIPIEFESIFSLWKPIIYLNHTGLYIK